MNDLSKKRALTLREVDRLIAEQIFGMKPCKQWKRVSLGSAGGPALMHGDGTLKHDYECYPDVEDVPTVRGTLGGPLRYTADIAATWRLVDKMHERGFNIIIERTAKGSTYKVELSPAGSTSGAPGATVTEKTAPLAISLAALKVYEIEVAVSPPSRSEKHS